MCPQFVDFNADGYDDIITATFEGTAFIVEGSATGWQAPEHLTDSQGRNIVLSLYYDMKENRYDNADRSPEGTTNAGDHCVSTMVWDWDNDGDFDLLLGAKEGRLYLQRNEGSAGSPQFTGVNELLEAGGSPFNVPGGLTAPRLVDWDSDGLEDLICGSFKGGVYFYRNVGAVGAPVFAAPEQLIDAPEVGADDVRVPNNGVYADPVDCDNDGDLDLLVGGYCQWQPETPELTAEQEARIVELDKEMETIGEARSKFWERAEKETEAAETEEESAAIWDKIMQEDDYQKLEERWRACFEELSVLRPMMQREAGVWLFRRN